MSKELERRMSVCEIDLGPDGMPLETQFQTTSAAGANSSEEVIIPPFRGPQRAERSPARVF